MLKIFESYVTERKQFVRVANDLFKISSSFSKTLSDFLKTSFLLNF